MARAGRKDRGLLSKEFPTERGRKIVRWYVRLYHEGKERRFGSFNTKTEARDFYEKAKQEQKAGRFFPERYQHGANEPFQEIKDRYLKTLAGKKPTTIKAEEYFAKWWEARFKGKRLNAVTPAAIEDARQDLLKNGCTPQRTNRYLAWLRHVLNLAIRDGKLGSNPVNKVKLFKEPTGDTRYLSEEEEQKMMKALGPTHAQWARVAILTGLRQMEQFSLRWKDVDLERGLLKLPTTKAGGVQYVHLNEEAKAILQGMDAVAEAQSIANGTKRSEWVFPSENPATHVDPRNFYARVWMPAVEEAKIEWATWHSLRHTFASRLAMNGASEGTIAALLRHSGTALVRRYAHLSPSHLKAAVEGVSQFGKPADQEQKAVPEPVQEATNPSPTVTGTGTEQVAGSEENAEVVEK